MMFLNDRKPGRLAATLATTVVLLGAGACSGSGTNSASNNSAAPSKKTTTTVGAPAPFTEAAFTGSDEEFYLPPDPLPNGKPGELIRVQELGESDGTATVKVMYHSRDAAAIHGMHLNDVLCQIQRDSTNLHGGLLLLCDW